MRTVLIVGAVAIAAAVIIYFVLQGKSSSTDTGSPSGCPASFELHSAAGLVTTVYTIQNGKYFSQIKGGIGGYQGQLPLNEITKAEFESACKEFQTPAAS